MDENLTRELSYCIGELYEGLDEMRAEMVAVKAALKAGPCGGDQRMVHAEPVPRDLAALWSTELDRALAFGNSQNRSAAEEGPVVSGTALRSTARAVVPGSRERAEDESSRTAICTEQLAAILRLADSLDGIRDTLHQMLDRYR